MEYNMICKKTEVYSNKESLTNEGITNLNNLPQIELKKGESYSLKGEWEVDSLFTPEWVRKVSVSINYNGKEFSGLTDVEKWISEHDVNMFTSYGKNIFDVEFTVIDDDGHIYIQSISSNKRY